MLKSTIQITLFSILGIVISFFTQLLLAYYFGASEDRDAYYAALAIPTFITALFTGSVGMMFMPFLIKWQTDHIDKEKFRFFTSVVNLCAIFLLVIISLGNVFAEDIIGIVVPRYKPSLFKLTAYLFRVQLAVIFFSVLINLFSSFFQTKSSFIIPALAPIINSSITVLIIAIKNEWGITSVVYGNLIGSAIAFSFMLMIFLKRINYRWSFLGSNKYIGAIAYASLPLFSMGLLFRSNNLFERLFAARLPQGSLSYLGSANQIVLILTTIITSGIATTSFPLLSKYWYEGNFEALNTTFIRVANTIILFIFPMIVLFIVCGRDVIKLVFEHGAFHEKDTVALYYTLLGLMGFLLFGSLGNVVGKMLYISQNTWPLTLIATAELVIYILTSFILVKSHQFIGLAISMSIGAAFNIFACLAFIKKRISDINIKSLLIHTAITVLVSVLILFMMQILNNQFFKEVPTWVKVLTNTLIVMLSYFAVLFKIKSSYFKYFELFKKW